MSWTQIDEHYGGSVRVTAAADVRLRLPFGRGGARFYDIDNGGAGLKIRLPDATRLRAGAHVYCVLLRSGSSSMQVVAADGSTVVGVISAGTLANLHLLDASTSNGTWVIDAAGGSPSIGSTLTLGREPYHIELGGESQATIDLRRIVEGRGYSGVAPVALLVEVGADAVLGSGSPSLGAIESGEFPAGSTLLMFNRGRILGRGGLGGTGATSSGTGGAGEAGGPALGIAVSAVLVNDGTIGGGGGGGGGAKGTSGQGGGGGGGGAGKVAGQGADGAAGGTRGAAGAQLTGGAGGVGGNNGGSGGASGQAGAAGGGSGGAGGAAGPAVVKRAGASLTKIRTGSIFGAEVTA